MLPTRKSVPRCSRHRTTWRPPDHRKETQTAVVWSCLPFIRSGQNHFARHSERGKRTRQTEEEMGRQHQGIDRPEVRQVPEGSGKQGKMEETGCEIIWGAPTTLVVKGYMRWDERDDFFRKVFSVAYKTSYDVLLEFLYAFHAFSAWITHSHVGRFSSFGRAPDSW